MKDEFKRSEMASAYCCWRCDKPNVGGDTAGARRMYHQLARAKMRRALYASTKEED